MKRGLLVISMVLVLLMVPVLANAVTITYWHLQVGKEAPMTDDDLVGNFMVENPGIKVILEDVPAPYMEEKTLLAIISGQMPNVERDFIGRLAAWGYKGVLENLDEFLSPADLEDFHPTLVDVCRMKGELIALPIEFWLVNYVVNKTILDRAGAAFYDGEWTVDQWMEAADKVLALGDPNIWPTVFFAKDEQGDYWTLQNFQMYGAKLWTDGDHTKTTLNSSEGVKALEWMVWLTQNGYAPPGTIGRKGAEIIGLFDSGKIAMCGGMGKQGTLVHRQVMLDSGQVDELQDVRMVATPHIDGMPTAGLYFGLSAMAVFEEKDDEKRAAAIKLVQYLCNPYNSKMLAIGDYLYSACQSVDTWPDEPSFQRQTQMMNEYGGADLGLASPFYLQARHLLYPELQQAYAGLKTAKQALDDFAKGIEKLWE